MVPVPVKTLTIEKSSSCRERGFNLLHYHHWKLVNMNPQLAFLALSRPENLQILSCLRKNEQRFSGKYVYREEEVKICLECLHSETGISHDSLLEGLSLLIDSELISIEESKQRICYQRNEDNLKKLAELLERKSLLTQERESQNICFIHPLAG